MKKIVVGNWKMNCNVKEATKLANGIISGLTKINSTEVILCPPFTALSAVCEVIKSSNSVIKLGAQNCDILPCGAYTGEISAKMLKDFCEYVVLGHSERRKYFGEDDAMVNKKIKIAVEYGLRPIVCVGEWTKGDNSKGILFQVGRAIKGLKDKEAKSIIFAYEPVWAIGTGDEADPSYASKIIKAIKQEIPEGIPVLYGGSVDASNILGFAKQSMIDGVFVGGASLKAKEFLKIIEKVRG